MVAIVCLRECVNVCWCRAGCLLVSCRVFGLLPTKRTSFSLSLSLSPLLFPVSIVMKMNPEYKKWKDAQSGGAGGGMPPPSAPTNPQALPIVSNMDDHAQLNEDLGQDIPLSESTNATIEMMQEPEISLEAGMQPDEMVDELGNILAKYEVPMGLMNKCTSSSCIKSCLRAVSSHSVGF